MSKHVTEKVDYYHNRPFLIVDIYYKPIKSVRTHQKDWSKTPSNWQSDEQPYVVNRISFKQLCRASVILDITNNSLIKNRFDKNSDAEIYQHFASKYALQINEAKQVWKLRERITKTEERESITVTMV